MLQLSSFRVGNRVQLHPGTDQWMQGDKYGEVIKVGRKMITLKMDRSGRTVRAIPDNILEIVD